MKALIQHMDESAEYYFEEGCWILELLNAPEDARLSIARARVEPGTTTARHRLSDIDERYIVLEGRGRVEVGGLPPEDVGPGDVVVIPAGSPQSIANVGAVDLVFLAVCTPPFTPKAYRGDAL